MNIERIRKKLSHLKEITGGSYIDCGYMYDEVALLVYSLIKFYKPNVIIQTGHLWGKSALIGLEALTDGFTQTISNGFETEDQLSDVKYNKFVKNHKPEQVNPIFISIDPIFPVMAAKYKDGIEFLREQYPAFQFIKDSSHNALPKLEINSDRVLCIVDGDHTFGGCLQDLQNMNRFNPLLQIVDDTLFLDDCGDACLTFAKQQNKEATFFDLYNGICIIK